MTILISEVRAQEIDATQIQPEFSIASFAPLILVLAIIYFLIIRPQSKKIKEHQTLVNALKIGDKVITNSGIIGVIREIDKKDNIVEVEISSGVVVKMLRNFVAELADKKEEKPNKKSKK